MFLNIHIIIVPQSQRIYLYYLIQTHIWCSALNLFKLYLTFQLRKYYLGDLSDFTVFLTIRSITSKNNDGRSFDIVPRKLPTLLKNIKLRTHGSSRWYNRDLLLSLRLRWNLEVKDSNKLLLWTFLGGEAFHLYVWFYRKKLRLLKYNIYVIFIENLYLNNYIILI